MFGASGDGGRIGLLAGEGELPVIFLEAALSAGRKVVSVGVEGLVDPRVRERSEAFHTIGLGEAGRLAGILRAEKLRKVVLAGGIPKVRLYDPKLTMDEDARSIVLPRKNKGDDHLLRAFEWYLRVRCGVRIVDARTLLKDALAPRGVLTRRAPTPEESSDLKFGARIARGIGRMDIGQTVVVNKGVVLAVEAVEGTDAAIRRGGQLGNGGAVVKTSKPTQSLRFDLPCAGVRTIASMKESGCTALGVEAGKTLLIGRDELIRRADEADITIVGI